MGGERERLRERGTIEGGTVAHGIHGIHGKGDGRWEEKENDYENEERSRAEDWPTEYTEYTERGAGSGGGGGKVGVNLVCGRGRGWRERPLANRRDLN